MKRAVLFVAPLPPPLHGFSGVCAAMLGLLRDKAPVETFDRAPRSRRTSAKVFLQLHEATRFLRTARQNRNLAVYLGLSGGLGQLVDAIYVVISRAYHKQVFIHHHSFAYINSPTPLSKFILSIARDSTHIVLSSGMGASLAKLYKLDERSTRVISNAAFLETKGTCEKLPSASVTPIRIGFLSNITLEKGIIEFFEVLQELRRLEVPYQAKVAGPIASDARQRLAQLLASSSQVDYVGPQYGEDKERFYQQLDILLFPTRYVNEAEPLVVHEAMRSAVHVIACNRGAIAEILCNGAGLVLSQDEFVISAAKYISSLNADRHGLAQAQHRSFEQACRLHVTASSELLEIINEIVGIT
jgi:glycosyltransferase involved in cell wall biosynthesis